ncbi:LysM peptidoglycan-binding domain-containing protein [Aerococcus vaginalis]
MNQNLKKTLATGATVLGSVFTLAAYQSVAADHAVMAAPNGTTYDINNPFLSKIAGPASELAGQNDLYASVMMAQAILETGWGSSQLSQEPYNNLFGIKGSYQGNSVDFNTLEDDGTGNYYQINDGFRKYPSVRESLQDYVNLIRGGISGDPNFYSGVWKSNTNSYRDATAALTGRYATDTSYATKLNSIIESNDLTRFDQGPVSVKPSTGTPSQSQGSNSSETQKPQQNSGKSYTVKAGDGLWTVAQNLGVSIDQVKRANGLTSNLIFPGQVLYAGSGSAQSNASQSASKPANRPNSSNASSNAARPQGNNKSYTVKAGDGLWTVAQNLGVSIDQVKRANGLTSNLIFPGQVLYAGSRNAQSNASQSTSKPANRPNSSNASSNAARPQGNGKSYTVKAGDGLWTVAQNLGVSIDQVKRANGLTSNLIFPGQVLYAGSGNAQSNASQSMSKGTSTNATVSRPTVQSQQQSSVTGAYYTVKSGDTQWRIATTHGLTLAQFQALNGFKNANLYVGQKVRVSGQVSMQQTTQRPQAQSRPTQSVVSKPSATNQATQTTTATSGKYTVKAGDNLYRIAVNNGVTLDALLKANNFGSANALILPGQVLTIPAK